MRLNITARHGKASEELIKFTEKEVRRIKKYYSDIIDCDVILDYIKRTTKVADIRIGVYGQVLTAVEKTDDIRISIKQAVDKLERQLIKYKGKLRGFEREKAVDHITSTESAEEAEDSVV